MPRPTPQPREPRNPLWGPAPALRFRDGTWLESESLTYPSGGYHRRAYATIRPNSYRDGPEGLPYGEKRVVWCSIPDTWFSVPARWTSRRFGTVRGFVSTIGTDEFATLVFTPTP